MKKVFFLVLASISTCFAQKLEVTEIIKDLNLYVFDNTYVIKLDRAIPGVRVGSKLNIDTDYFYHYTEWLQDISIRRKVLVGVNVEHKTVSNKTRLQELLDNDNSDLQKVHETVEKKEYKYVTTVKQFRMTPIGTVYKEDYYGLVDFELFLKDFEQTPFLATYNSVDLDHGWISTSLRPQRTNFVGDNVSIWWVLDHMKTYGSEFTHIFRPIYNRNDNNLLAGVLTHVVSYGSFGVMRDFEAYGLATLDDPYVVQ